MKSLYPVALCLAVSIAKAQAQNDNSPAPPPTAAKITSTGANFNIWQWQTFEILGNGQTAAHNHTVTELASGLNFQNPATGQWLPSQETIRPYAQGAKKGSVLGIDIFMRVR